MQRERETIIKGVRCDYSRLLRCWKAERLSSCSETVEDVPGAKDSVQVCHLIATFVGCWK